MSAQPAAVEMTLEQAQLGFPPMWVIYDHPLDCPDAFVVRVWYGAVMEPEAGRAADLVRARELAVIDGASGFFERSSGDDPSIVEVWI